MQTAIDQIDQVEATAENLSARQKSVMEWLLKSVEILEQRKDSVGLDWLERGVPWKPKLSRGSARASMSRSLVRLETKGLINRVAPRGRTTRLMLTNLGRLVALRLRD